MNFDRMESLRTANSCPAVRVEVLPHGQPALPTNCLFQQSSRHDLSRKVFESVTYGRFDTIFLKWSFGMKNGVLE